ncbi:hypothetical protein cyc_03872 [Cyclospora cayetanensis]|uniref:Uncharacterized protein n=1 Tax=Cyclospora cayetanensis TaxID=88456 RepID=A0A1D3D7V5_9EIME|nr:hypothetical protein cyc_03872 [Cyclospora cayetanensis]
MGEEVGSSPRLRGPHGGLPREDPPRSSGGPPAAALGGPLPLACICPPHALCRRSLPKFVARAEGTSSSVGGPPEGPQTCLEDCQLCRSWFGFIRGCRVPPTVLRGFVSLTFYPFKLNKQTSNPASLSDTPSSLDQGNINKGFPMSCWQCNPYRGVFERVMHCGMRGKDGFAGRFHRLLASQEFGIRVFLSIDPRYIRGVSFAARSLALKCLSKFILALLYQTLFYSSASSCGSATCRCSRADFEDATDDDEDWPAKGSSRCCWGAPRGNRPTTGLRGSTRFGGPSSKTSASLARAVVPPVSDGGPRAGAPQKPFPSRQSRGFLEKVGAPAVYGEPAAVAPRGVSEKSTATMGSPKASSSPHNVAGTARCWCSLAAAATAVAEEACHLSSGTN